MPLLAAVLTKELQDICRKLRRPAVQRLRTPSAPFQRQCRLLTKPHLLLMDELMQVVSKA